MFAILLIVFPIEKMIETQSFFMSVKKFVIELENITSIANIIKTKFHSLKFLFEIFNNLFVNKSFYQVIIAN